MSSEWQPGDLELAWQKIIDLLETTQTPYIVIGGLAVAVVGEPRATMDLDFDIKIQRNSPQALREFLTKAKEAGFDFDEKQILHDAVARGAFRLLYEGRHIDLILASTPLEEAAIGSSQKVKLLDRQANFPRPEDLILLKIIPGRAQDIADIERIMRLHKNRLNLKYLLDWARRLSDEMEDMRVYNTLKQMSDHSASS